MNSTPPIKIGLVSLGCAKNLVDSERMLGLLAQGWNEAEILRNYPGLTREQILACVAYAQERLSDEKVFAVAK